MEARSKLTAILLAGSSVFALPSCGTGNVGDPTDEAVSSEDDANQIDNEATGSMTEEGELVEVLESFPLQLVVESDAGTLKVALSEDVIITQNSETVDESSLKPGQQLRLSGVGAGLSMTATEIEILS